MAHPNGRRPDELGIDAPAGEYSRGGSNEIVGPDRLQETRGGPQANTQLRGLGGCRTCNDYHGEFRDSSYSYGSDRKFRPQVFPRAKSLHLDAYLTRRPASLTAPR